VMRRLLRLQLREIEGDQKEEEDAKKERISNRE
jgi:hypothetical protein